MHLFLLLNSMQHTNACFHQFLGLPLFRNVTLKCLTEIAGVAVPSYDESYIMMFSQTITQLQEVSFKIITLYIRA